MEDHDPHGRPQLEANFDALWRRRALAGDPAAARALTDSALGPLYAFCLYRLGQDRHLCEEVVQETLVRAIEGLDAYDPDRSGGNIFPWLTGLARNEIRRALSRRKPAASLQALWEKIDGELLQVYARLDSEQFEGGLLRREETREMVSATMSQLPPHYRKALEAKYVQGQSVRDIAAATRASEKAVESQLTRAREAFRATFLALARNLNGEPLG
jgi:RNA polymerase sigma-70 factor (ECF subfamily)